MDLSHMPTVAEWRAYDSHEFDEHTNYCRHCGQRASHVVENKLLCFGDDPKIVAISHLRRPPVDELAGADAVWKNPA